MRLTLALLLALTLRPGAPESSGAQPVSLLSPQIEDVQVIQGPVPARPVARDPRSGPSASAGTAVISGIVVSADGGRPVRRAAVRLAPLTPAPPMSTRADEQGRFTFTNVPAGRFTLSASKPGYLDSVFGQRRPGSGRPGTPLSIAEGQRLDRLSLPIARGGVLAGTVTDDGGEPAFGTIVRAYRAVWDSGDRTVRLAGEARADDRGQYRIGALPPGEYLVMAVPPGSRTLGPERLALLPANAAFRVDGSVTAPMVAFSPDGGGSADDVETYSPVFFPGSVSSQGATVVALELGEERSGLDVQMPFIATGRVAGVVTSQGQPSAGVEVRLDRADETVPLSGQATMTGQDGAFAFSGITPGPYRITAHTGPQRRVQIDRVGGQTRVMMQFTSVAATPRPDGAPFPPPGMTQPPDDQRQLWAGADVSVNGRETQQVALALEPGVTITGRVTFDGTGQPPSDLQSVMVVLNGTGTAASATGSAFTGRVDPDGRFVVADVLPGRYRPAVVAGQWHAKRFDVQGVDALDAGLDVQPGRAMPEAAVTLTTRMGTVTGTLTDAAGQPAAAYTLVVFAEDQAYWTPRSRRIDATRPATDGRFAIGDLPAGRYRLAAVEDIGEGQWYDPALLSQLLGSAIPIDLGDGATVTQDVRLAR